VYLALNLENIITVGVILLCWMLAVHLIGQAGVSVASWLPGSGG
jgi:hypothetical protein